MSWLYSSTILWKLNNTSFPPQRGQRDVFEIASFFTAFWVLTVLLSIWKMRFNPILRVCFTSWMAINSFYLFRHIFWRVKHGIHREDMTELQQIAIRQFSWLIKFPSSQATLKNIQCRNLQANNVNKSLNRHDCLCWRRRHVADLKSIIGIGLYILFFV